MSITNATTFLLLLLLAFGHGHLDVDKLIKEKCTDKKHSFVVSLMKRVTMKPVDFVASAICTGSLLTMGWVLTTASCLFKVLRTIGALRSYPNVSVIAGFDPTQEHFEERTIAKFVPFNPKLLARGMRSQTDDLVLIELSKPFEPSAKVGLIKLAKTGQAEKCKQGETVSTIPHIELNGPRAGKTAVNVVCKGINLVKTGVCSRVWSWLKSKSSLCGETRSKREVGSEECCAGAEGSPLVCDGALIGLQSKCKRAGDMRSDAVQTSFLKLEPYMDFITNTIADLRDELNKEKRHKKKGMKETTDKPSSSEMIFFDGALWKMAAGVCAVLFVYF